MSLPHGDLSERPEAFLTRQCFQVGWSRTRVKAPREPHLATLAPGLVGRNVHAVWRTLVTLTLVAAGVCPLLLRDEPLVVHVPSAFAVVGLDPARHAYQGDDDNGDNDDADNEDEDNDDGDNDDGDNEDGDNDDNENDNDDDEDEDGFDLCAIYEELGIAPPSSLGCSRSISAKSAPVRSPEPTCSTPGQDTVFTSHDGKVTLRIFASSPRPVRVVLYQVINADTAPAPPGAFVRPLVYEVWASYCDAQSRRGISRRSEPGDSLQRPRGGGAGRDSLHHRPPGRRYRDLDPGREAGKRPARELRLGHHHSDRVLHGLGGPLVWASPSASRPIGGVRVEPRPAPGPHATARHPARRGQEAGPGRPRNRPGSLGSPPHHPGTSCPFR